MKLIVRPGVYADLEEAFVWYVKIDQNPSDRLESDFDELLELLENSLTRFARAYKDFRHAKLSDFPYYVYYRIAQSTVIVVLFIHTSRNPIATRRALKKSFEH